MDILESLECVDPQESMEDPDQMAVMDLRDLRVTRVRKVFLERRVSEVLWVLWVQRVNLETDCQGKKVRKVHLVRTDPQVQRVLVVLKAFLVKWALLVSPERRVNLLQWVQKALTVLLVSQDPVDLQDLKVTRVLKVSPVFLAVLVILAEILDSSLLSMIPFNFNSISMKEAKIEHTLFPF